MLTGLIFFSACNRCKFPVEPEGQCGNTCIMNKIGAFSQSANICNGSATVKQYTFQSENVYVFDQGTCGADFTQSVLNENCDTLGYLGGIAGNAQINGQNFYDNATYVSTVWNN